MRAFLPTFQELQECYEHMGFTFTIVYIKEAHAQDEWPMSSGRYMPKSRRGQVVMVNQHRTLDDRVKACRQMLDTFKYHNANVLIDTMENTFMDAFAAWPFRYFVIDNYEVRLIGMPGEISDGGDKFSMKPLEEFLSTFQYNYQVRSTPFEVVARMLHYSSGRKGFSDLQL